MISTLPTRVLAGVTVPDTLLITKAIVFARANVNDITFNHVMRSWLFGQFIADAIPELRHRDQELHAITAILHDLCCEEFISKDKIFEVDGANATRAFLIREGKKEDWNRRRLQLAWETVAFHSKTSISMYKEAEVKSCISGILADFLGPERSLGGVLTRKLWNQINREFPRHNFKNGLTDIFCGLCVAKPETTYDNFAAALGEAFVPGYKQQTFLETWEAVEG